MLWLSACLAALLGGVAGPPVVRWGFGLILVAANLAAIRGTVLLRGARAVRRLEWDDEGRFHVWLGDEMAPRPATLGSASFRLGIAFLVLWLETPVGRRLVLVDGGRQEPVAFRRLVRRLSRGC